MVLQMVFRASTLAACACRSVPKAGPVHLLRMWEHQPLLHVPVEECTKGWSWTFVAYVVAHVAHELLLSVATQGELYKQI
jgi:hypothetical protein